MPNGTYGGVRGGLVSTYSIGYFLGRFLSLFGINSETK